MAGCRVFAALIVSSSRDSLRPGCCALHSSRSTLHPLSRVSLSLRWVRLGLGRISRTSRVVEDWNGWALDLWTDGHRGRLGLVHACAPTWRGGGGERNVFVRSYPIYVVACVTGFRASCAFIAIVSQGVRPSRPYHTCCTGRGAPIGNPLRPSINAAPCYTAGSWCARLAARARVLESVLNADGSLSGRVVCEGTARPPCPPPCPGGRRPTA